MNKKIVYSVVLVCVTLGLFWWFGMPEDASVSKVDAPNIPSAPSSTEKIIAFGDSLTAGYGVSQAEAYPAQLEEALKERGLMVSVINAGVSGETSRGNLERAPFIRSQNPTVVILGIGGNDALRALPIEETEKNILATIDILQSGEEPPQVLLLKMQAPLNAGREYKEQFDALYPAIASARSLTLVPFITEDIFFNPDYKLADGIHYNKAGYEQVIDQYLLAAILETL